MIKYIYFELTYTTSLKSGEHSNIKIQNSSILQIRPETDYHGIHQVEDIEKLYPNSDVSYVPLSIISPYTHTDGLFNVTRRIWVDFDKYEYYHLDQYIQSAYIQLLIDSRDMKINSIVQD
jgi:hypothetical protein